MRGLFFLLALVVVAPHASSAQTFVAAPISVRNYRRAPIHLDVIRTWIKLGDSSKRFETCVEVKVFVRTTDKIDSFSYQIGPRGSSADTLVKMSVPEIGNTITECISIDRTSNHKEFVLRLNFVENSNGTVWESKRHKEEVQKLFKVFIPVDPS